MTRPGDADWLERRADTLFRLDGEGRILAVRDPSQPAPRLFLQRSAGAVAFRLRAGLPEGLASELANLVRLEPPAPPGAPLVQAAAIQACLGDSHAPGGGPVYALTSAGTLPFDPALVRSGSEAGDALTRRWRLEGLPRSLSDLGFTDADDLWPPWVARLQGDEIVALCQSARLSDQGAEAGVITDPAFRRQGFGAQVTRAWAGHPDLAGRTLYYSTAHANTASQALAGRLGLTKVAEDWRFA